jgi:predicted amidohydrolase
MIILTVKICAAQFRPVAGDIAANTATHIELIEFGVGHGADLVYFPELSLTGYEPRLAKTLATRGIDASLEALQERSNSHDIMIGVGLPLSVGYGVQIGMVWLSPNAPQRTYAKQRLHADELPFFVPGAEQLVLESGDHLLAPAICYESLQPNHAQEAAALGADVYLASVAKPAAAFARATLHYPAMARTYSMYVIMANCVGPSDDFVSVGQTAAWDWRGKLLAQMDANSEGIVLVDTVTGIAAVHVLPNT